MRHSWSIIDSVSLQLYFFGFKIHQLFDLFIVSSLNEFLAEEILLLIEKL